MELEPEETKHCADIWQTKTYGKETVMDNDISHAIAFMYEVGHLKNTPRAGWLLAGVRSPESVAEHSQRVAVIAYVVATMEGANADRAAAMAVLHDIAETRTSDLPSVGKRHVSPQSAEDIMRAQIAGMSDELAAPLQQLVGEYEARETLEARCVKDADKLECLLQAIEYQAAGNRQLQPWIDTMMDGVRTESGKVLANAAIKVSADSWWYDIVSSYGR
jgi:putative hydrolase of HD superfamily